MDMQSIDNLKKLNFDNILYYDNLLYEKYEYIFNLLNVVYDIKNYKKIHDIVVRDSIII